MEEENRNSQSPKLANNCVSPNPICYEHDNNDGSIYCVNKEWTKGDKVRISNKEEEVFTVELGTSVKLDDELGNLSYEVAKLTKVKSVDEIWEENHKYCSAGKELLHKQFLLLAKRSNDCSNEELIKISEQMVRIHNTLSIGL